MDFKSAIGTVAALVLEHWKIEVGRVCVCVCVFKSSICFNQYNGIAICSRLAGGGRGPSVDLVLVAVPFLLELVTCSLRVAASANR